MASNLFTVLCLQRATSVSLAMISRANDINEYYKHLFMHSLILVILEGCG
jgi:hypothetical protein